MGADKCGQKRGVATAHRPRRIQKRVEKEKNALPNKIRSANKQHQAEEDKDVVPFDLIVPSIQSHRPTLAPEIQHVLKGRGWVQ